MSVKCIEFIKPCTKHVKNFKVSTRYRFKIILEVEKVVKKILNKILPMGI